MILVVADDLSGAAEIGGVAWRHGLHAEVQTTLIPGSTAEVLVVDAGTRACAAEQAIQRTRDIASLSRAFDVAWAFKKVDSVVRGHVLDELVALLECWGRRRALIVCANPGLGRTVVAGQYLVHGCPLDETDLSRDPRYPAHTSDVRQLLIDRSEAVSFQRWPVHVLAPPSVLPERGVVIGEAGSGEDVTHWAQELAPGVFPVGASEFFAACLSSRGHRPKHRGAEPSRSGSRSLFVSGSTSAYGHQFYRACEVQGTPVLRMPTALFAATDMPVDLVEEWAESTARALRQHSRAVVAIDRPICSAPGLTQRLSSLLAELVEQVLAECPLDHLYVDGGDTARALLRRMGWTRLWIDRELAPGIVSTRIRGQGQLRLTMKPGSYVWPKSVAG